MSDKTHKIVRLQAENIKRIKAVDITPGDGSTVVIGGNNGAGKTSILDAITYALSGARSICDRPIRDGEDRAQVICELENIIITRTWDASGTRLQVESRDGAKYPSPQAMLDDLTSALTFDPLAFANSDSKKQVATLKKLAGVTFGDLDLEKDKVTEERLELGRHAKALEGQRKGIQTHDDAPDEEVKAADIMAKMDAAQAHNSELLALEDTRVRTLGAISHHEDAISDIINELDDLKEKLERHKELKSKQEALLYETEGELRAAKPIQLEPLREELSGIEAINAKVRDNRRAAELDVELAGARDEYANLTGKLKDIEHQKHDRLAGANLPIDGLSFDDAGVTFGGVPFAQASAAERLRVSVAMGLALNPGLRVMLIRDGSLLDKNNMEMIAEMASEHDAQVWIERVGDGAEVAIVIESGEVSEVRVAAE